MSYMLFAVSAAAGIGLILTGIAGGNITGRRILTEDENGDLRTVPLSETTVFAAMLADLSERIRPDDGTLETRLRKSGWVFSGPMEYHARRMTLAILFFMIPLVPGFLLKASFSTVAVLSTAAAVFGFVTPDRKISSGIKERQRKIRREMGFGLEKVTLMLTSGEQLDRALSGAKNCGEFGRICEHIAVGRTTNRKIGDIIDEIRAELPEISVMNEFLELLRMESRGQNLTEPFRVMAMLQRDSLENEIIESGGKAKVKLTMMTSAFVMMSSLFVLIGPIFIILRNTGF